MYNLLEYSYNHSSASKTFSSMPEEMAAFPAHASKT